MADDRTTALFFELFTGLPRQGPGDAASTLRALALVPGVGPRTRILDVGCGTGLHTRVLAQGSPARIVAVDNPRLVRGRHLRHGLRGGPASVATPARPRRARRRDGRVLDAPRPAGRVRRVLADQAQREIDVWRRYSGYYSYEFFVMRAR